MADEKTMKKYNKQFDLKVNSLSIIDIARCPIESFRDIYDTVKYKIKYPDK